MYLNDELSDVKITCINLTTRKDKRRYMEKQAKRRNMEIGFHTVKPHSKPTRGCLESHLAVIRQAIKGKLPYILILEDDCQFKRTFKDFPVPPTDWDMLFLGGTVKSIYDRPTEYPDWVRMCCWTTHAYMVNLRNAKLVEDLLKMEYFPGEIDTYYIRYIQNKYNAYMISPMMAIQKEGYSDIECQNVNYDFMEATLRGLKKPKHTVVNGEYVLKLPVVPTEQLPYVSIVTPTYNRRNMFALPLYCMENFDYPRDKIEWVIVDDTPANIPTIEDMLPKRTEYTIKYVNVRDRVTREMEEEMEMNGGRLTIGRKRNMCVESATHDIILHMDDDDYYPPETVLARVKILMAYEDVDCVGSSKIGVYDIMSNASSLATDGDMSIAEATMGYRRSFWEEQGFNDLDRRGEYRNFIGDRFDRVMDIPYSFIIIAISHMTNYTEKTRRVEENQLVESVASTGSKQRETNFYDTWDEETRVFMDDMRRYLARKKRV